MEMLIVGAGQMGRWFAATVADPDDRVAFLDVDPGVAEAAATDTDDATAHGPESTTSAELVCIAVPLSIAERAIEANADRATEAIVDVSGAMTGPLEAMREAGGSLERVSLHPLFAPRNAPGNVAVVADRSGSRTETILGRLEAAGNDLVETTAEEHDRAMETVQAAAHAAILSYGVAAEPVPDGLQTPVSSRLQELLETVTDGNPRVYADIQERFPGAEAVAAAAADIASADSASFERLYRDAGKR